MVILFSLLIFKSNSACADLKLILSMQKLKTTSS